MAKFSFTFGTNHWFSFSFETGSTPTVPSAPASLVRYEHGTTRPNTASNATLEKKRLAGHALIESLAADVARHSQTKLAPLSLGPSIAAVPARKAIVSSAQVSWKQDFGNVDQSKFDPALKKETQHGSDRNIEPKEQSTSVVAAAAPNALRAEKECQFLSIPPEIRILIYEHILVSRDPITNAHKLLEGDDSIDATDHEARIQDIDSRILRTCRSILKETVPILYGKNTFHFSKQDHIEAFKVSGLTRTWSQGEKISEMVSLYTINLATERYGRLAFVRRLSLRLGSSDSFISHVLRQDPKKGRDHIWQGWSKLFDRDHRWELNFPALEMLTLDVSDWLLTAGDVVRVDRFVKKFKSDHGLNRLIIKGMSNNKNLQDLRSGLVKPGGVFESSV